MRRVERETGGAGAVAARMAETTRPANGLKHYLYTAFAGLTMGAADVVPGVSGGTMAFIMGIYEELVDALKSFNWRLLIMLLRLRFRDAVAAVPWRFLAVLGAGITVSLLVLAGPIGWLLDHHPVPLFAFFLGLVLASIVTVAARLRWSADRGTVPPAGRRTRLLAGGSGSNGHAPRCCDALPQRGRRRHRNDPPRHLRRLHPAGPGSVRIRHRCRPRP